MGTLLIAISLFTQTAAAAALYYLVHSTLAAALLFLVADLVMERQGPVDPAVSKPMPQTGLISALFFAAAIALAGMPPLSGFLGKLLVLDATPRRRPRPLDLGRDPAGIADHHHRHGPRRLAAVLEGPRPAARRAATDTRR